MPKRKASILTAYQYSYGDTTLYWDCYIAGGFVGRAHSIAELALMAQRFNGKYKIIL